MRFKKFTRVTTKRAIRKTKDEAKIKIPSSKEAMTDHRIFIGEDFCVEVEAFTTMGSTVVGVGALVFAAAEAVAVVAEVFMVAAAAAVAVVAEVFMVVAAAAGGLRGFCFRSF